MATTYFPLKFCTIFIEFHLRKIKVSRNYRAVKRSGHPFLNFLDPSLWACLRVNTHKHSNCSDAICDVDIRLPILQKYASSNFVLTFSDIWNTYLFKHMPFTYSWTIEHHTISWHYWDLSKQPGKNFFKFTRLDKISQMDKVGDGWKGLVGSWRRLEQKKLHFPNF